MGGEGGLSIIEALVVFSLMAIVGSGMTTLVGTALKSKVIIAARSADQETARQALEWMAERLRNAGLNIDPSAQPDRCDDMVATVSGLRPSANAVYVAGEILNSNTTAGDEVSIIGYRLGNDPVSGQQVIMEYRQACASSTGTDTPLTAPRITVATVDGQPGLTFDYFKPNGTELTTTDLADAAQIRQIRIVRISLTVKGSQGTSGEQVRTLTRDVMLRNPDPSLNGGWKNPDETP